jgi:hypothetical protein
MRFGLFMAVIISFFLSARQHLIVHLLNPIHVIILGTVIAKPSVLPTLDYSVRCLMLRAPLAGILQLHAKIICLEIKLGLGHVHIIPALLWTCKGVEPLFYFLFLVAFIP